MDELAGILHNPTQPGPLQRVGVVVIPGGLNRRAGLHRLYVLAARALAREGASVLRFDLPGVGESTGVVRGVTHARLASLDSWHVGEIESALDCLQRETAAEVLVLLGHCSGGRSAVACAALDTRVRGTVAWAMPVGSDDGPAPLPRLIDASQRLVHRGVPALWVYGTKDPAWPGFQTLLETLGDPDASAPPAPWTVRSVPLANHDFTSVPSTRVVLDITVNWMVGWSASLPTGKGGPWISP
jgi:dienelactone hydrolase